MHQQNLIVMALGFSLALAAAHCSHRKPAAPLGGYWVDPHTRLMWTAEDNGYDVNWNQAQTFCRNLTTGGFRDWAMPTIHQLATISTGNEFDPVKGKIKLTSCCAWSATLDPNPDPRRLEHDVSSGFFGFGFTYQAQPSVLHDYTGTVVARALCVRGPKK